MGYKLAVDKGEFISMLSPMIFTTTTLAEYLGVSRFTIFKQLKRGVIKYERLNPKIILITQEEADKWLSAKKLSNSRSFFPSSGKLGRPRKKDEKKD